MCLAVGVLLAIGGCSAREPDACERAYARLDRIDASRGGPAVSGKPRDEALEQCRHGKHAAYDPVLRCAMDSASDEPAVACIEAFDREMIKARGAAPTEAPVGVNPLIEPAGQE